MRETVTMAQHSPDLFENVEEVVAKHAELINLVKDSIAKNNGGVLPASQHLDDVIVYRFLKGDDNRRRNVS